MPELAYNLDAVIREHTDLPEDRVKPLAKDFAKRIHREEKRHRYSKPDITFRPKNSSRIEFDVEIHNTTRSPQEILEDYLEKRDRETGGWRIRETSANGSLKSYVATRGVKRDSEKSDKEEALEALEDLSPAQKKLIQDTLNSNG